MRREHASDRHAPVDQYRRWLRLIGILDAANWSGLTPIDTATLHTLAYLADVLSPIWQLEPLDGKVLKQSMGPYYPSLQVDLDRLVGMGVVKVDSLLTTKSIAGDIQLQGLFSLNQNFSKPILDAMRGFEDESNVLTFMREVAQAFSRLSDNEMPTAMEEDATYGNPNVDTGEVIDFGEWERPAETASAIAAKQIDAMAGRQLKPAETIEIYVNHIIKRVSDGR
jgi:hypothetical protein